MFQNALLTFFVYFSIVIVMIVSFRYVNGIIFASKYRKGNLSFTGIAFFSVAFTLFDVFVTNLSKNNGTFGGFGGDRGNYIYSFLTERNNSLGLDLLFDFARYFSLDFTTLLYLIMFLCCFLTFYACKKMENVTPLTLALFLSTDVVFYMLSQLKQCFTNSFACIFFAFMFAENNKWNDFVCLLMAFFASCFHPTGCILFFLFFVYKFFDRSKNGFLYFILISLLILPFVEYLLYFLVDFFSFLPYVSSKIVQYFFTSSVESVEESRMAFLKGSAFYIISIYGIIRRQNFINYIKKYDAYLITSIYGSVFYLLSIVSYWMFRYTCLFYLPSIVFFCMLVKNEKKAFMRYSMIALVLLCLLVVRIRHIFLTYVNFGGY